MSPKPENPDWILAEEQSIPPDLLEAAGGQHLVAQILYRRGIRTGAQAKGFLDANTYTPASPYDFPGMDKAVERFRQAIEDHEPMLIWGDFDVDGQTSTTILVSTIQHLGGMVDYHIPNRETEGHGINLETLTKFLEKGYRLIITCDTGISANESIAAIVAAGVDVIITDHHELPAFLPVGTVAMVNPRFLPEGHPMCSMPGCAVAYELCRAVLESMQDTEFHQELLDLVALGIVADVAEQTGDTRYLLQLGLRRLRITSRIGLQALMAVADVEQSTLNEEHIGFMLTPRLNALGRLSDANLAVEFFLTRDPARAQFIASELDGFNIQRKLLTDQVLQAALKQLEENPKWMDAPVLVIGQEGWPGGVLGIVAGNLVERFNKPAILLRIDPGGLARGSARSIAGINITDAIKSQKKILNTFGGHPMAAGLSLPSELVPDFRQMITHTVQERSTQEIKKNIIIDAVIPINDMDLKFTRELEVLAPFGNGNRAPNFLSRNLGIIQATPIGKAKDHLSIQVEDALGDQTDVIWWQGAGQALPDARFDLLYHARAGVYRGEDRLQLEWIYFQATNETVTDDSTQDLIKIIDYRSVLAAEELLNNIRQMPESVIWAEGSDRKTLGAVDRLELTPAKRLVIWTTPASAGILSKAIADVSPREVVLFCRESGLDESKSMVTRMVGLMRQFSPSGGIPVPIPLLSAACAQRPGTIMDALRWLACQGEIQIRKLDHEAIIFDWRQSKPAINVLELTSKLERDLQETAAYRNYLSGISINEWRVLLSQSAPK